MNKIAEALRIFFAISDKTLASSLDRAATEFEALSEKLDDMQEIPPQTRGAAVEADIWHRRLVQAYAISQSERVAPETATFFAGVAAGTVADAVDQMRNEAPRRAGMAQRIEELKAQGRCCSREERAWEDAARTDARIHDMIFDFVLRRYRLAACADLFERSPEEFELHRDIGMFVVWGKAMNCGEVENFEQYAYEKLGSKLFQQMKTRIAEIREMLG